MRLLLIDGHYYVFRSFFAIRELRSSNGDATNAIYGFIKTVRRMLKDPRSRSLAEQFGGQWLGFNALHTTATPDRQGSRGGNVAYLDGSVVWKRLDDMARNETYSGSTGP